ncbi:unnamed protein product [Euphydryas editha]|uniref:HAT C-terminal dimerisation domain-containing protein n=1 Tax=Euphydryas editha TaxID=104508 RepID=A0AAU9TZT6_EUPED|nr:unnamed protein product [Euphydryas editha]
MSSNKKISVMWDHFMDINRKHPTIGVIRRNEITQSSRAPVSVTGVGDACGSSDGDGTNGTTNSSNGGEIINSAHYNVEESCELRYTLLGCVPLEEAHTDRNLAKIIKEEYPLKWWKTHRAIYPHPYQIAIQKLNAVASSVPCERVFSAAGNILNERRTRLGIRKLQQLIFLNQNM